MNVKVRRESSEQQRGGDVVFTTSHHRVRLAAYYGVPPGSHLGYWRTRVDSLRGVNLRVGKKIAGPTLTLMAHVSDPPQLIR